MTKYLIDCHKCTNMLISRDGSLYCRPAIEGRQPLYLADSGKENIDLVCCDEYTTEPKQIESYELVKGWSAQC